MSLLTDNRATLSRLRDVPLTEMSRLFLRYLSGLSPLGNLLNVNHSRVSSLTLEFRSSSPFAEGFKPLLNTDHFKAMALYCACRILHPQVVVETGVASGTSTVGILSALDRNGAGRLFSVDLPGATYTTDGGGAWADVSSPAGPGWLVPDRLRARWDIRIGSSVDVLPGLISELDSVGLFYHDSEHTRSNMRFELDCVWGTVRAGGIILVDNVNWNNVFSEFCHDKDRVGVLLFPYLGALLK